MFKHFRNTAVATAILLTTGLFGCEKNQDVVPTQTSTDEKESLIIVKPKLFRLAKIGKTQLTYVNGKISKADDQHHRIQYDYPAADQILVSHYYNNTLAWNTLIKLDANGRALSSKSTDLSIPKKYVSEVRELFYSYTGDRLTSIKPASITRADQSVYQFGYYADNHPNYPGDLQLIQVKDGSGVAATTISFNYGYYVQSGKFAHTIPMTFNNANVNEAVHLGQWGAEPLADILDYFLPIYGKMSTHLINGVVISGPNGTGANAEAHYFVYDLDGLGRIENAYTLEESTTPFVYEAVN